MRGIRTINDLRDRCVIDDITGCWTCGPNVHKHSGVHIASAPEGRRCMSLGAAVYWLTKAKTIPPGRVYYSTCLGHRCANPAHRRLGTKRDNMLALGFRQTTATKAKIAATKRAASRFTEKDAQAIRDSDEPLSVLSKRYGTPIAHVARIRNGEAWRPLNGYGTSIFTGALR